MRENHSGVRTGVIICAIVVTFSARASAQFLDEFSGEGLLLDPSGKNGWTFFTGDGSAVMDFRQAVGGYASITVDATRDTANIWWALVRRRVSEEMNLGLLEDANHALRIESRIRVSDAPRRVNLHLNTQRTTDFHTHLMEFDIPDTTGWHTISMTTHGFDAVPGDSVYGQLALMDWGLATYSVDLDYVRVDIVRLDSAGSDKGVQVPYHPPVPDTQTFTHHVPVAEDATIDLQNPDLQLNDLSAREDAGETVLLAVSPTQSVILRWDVSPFAGRSVVGSGLLELRTYSSERLPDEPEEAALVRIVEILGGDPLWNQEEVSCASLARGEPLDRVFNEQMIIDVEIAEELGGRTVATISQPVLQRMIDGRTLGLAIRPLGRAQGTFYAIENQGGALGPRLHLDFREMP